MVLQVIGNQTCNCEGFKGDPGDRGYPGIPGIQGEYGEDGLEGRMGVVGDTGDFGDVGDIGDKGERVTISTKYDTFLDILKTLAELSRINVENVFAEHGVNSDNRIGSHCPIHNNNNTVGLELTYHNTIDIIESRWSLHYPHYNRRL